MPKSPADTLKKWLDEFGSHGFLVRTDGSFQEALAVDYIVDGGMFLYLPTYGERVNIHTVEDAELDGEELRLDIGDGRVLVLSYWWTEEHKRILDQWASDKVKLNIPELLDAEVARLKEAP